MPLRCLPLCVMLTLLPLAAQRRAPPAEPEATANVRLPNGKNQQEEILKAEHEKNVEEMAKMIRLAGEVQDELLKQDRHVLSLGSLKKLEEIEKLAKRVKSRIRR